MPSYSKRAGSLHVSKVGFLLYTVLPFLAPFPLAKLLPSMINAPRSHPCHLQKCKF